MSNVKKDELQINLTELVKDKKKLFEKHFFAVRRRFTSMSLRKKLSTGDTTTKITSTKLKMSPKNTFK